MINIKEQRLKELQFCPDGSPHTEYIDKNIGVCVKCGHSTDYNTLQAKDSKKRTLLILKKV